MSSTCPSLSVFTLLYATATIIHHHATEMKFKIGLLLLTALQSLFPFLFRRQRSSNPGEHPPTKSHANKSRWLHLRWKRRRPKTPPILNLPVEIIVLIVKQLPLDAQYHLSQTCRAMRTITWRDFQADFRHLDRRSQQRFIMSLAHHRDGFWACASCRALHPIGHFDLPRATQPPPRRCLQVHQPFRLVAYPSLGYRHVQIALKLARTGKNPELLDLLMGSYMYRVPYWGTESISMKYAGIPRIRKGHFILYEEWVLHHEEQEMTREDIGEFDIGLCQHATLRPVDVLPLHFWRHNMSHPSLDIEMQFSRAIKDPGCEKKWTCRCCDTDCSIEMDKNKQRIRLQAWHDLGTVGFPRDPTWSRQVSGNWLLAYPPPHCHKSYARDLYNSCERPQLPKGWYKFLPKRIRH